MKVVVRDKKEIHLSDGPHGAGSVVELPEKIALRYLEAGAVERYETKVIREVPLPDAGAAEPSYASPAGQVSQSPTAKPSEDGDLTYPIPLKLRDNPPTPEETIAKLAKKRGRPRKASS